MRAAADAQQADDVSMASPREQVDLPLELCLMVPGEGEQRLDNSETWTVCIVCRRTWNRRQQDIAEHSFAWWTHEIKSGCKKGNFSDDLF